MDFAIILFIILLTTFILRGTYRLIVPKGLAISGDAVIHLIVAEGIRRNGHRIPEGFSEFLLSGPHNYPSFFHWLLSLISKERLEQYEPFIGTFIEMIHSTFIFFACYYLALKHGVKDPKLVGLFGSLIFTLTPLFIDHEGRVFSLSERPFGSLLGTVFLFFALHYLITSDMVFLVISVIIMVIIFISSKFTVQAIFFISFIFSILVWGLKVWLPILAGLIAAPLITKGYALKVLNGHIRHSIFYKKYLLKNYLRPKSQYFDLLKSFVTGIRNPLFFIQAFRRNSLLKIFSMIPWIILLVVLVGGNIEQVRVNILLRYLLLWILSSIIVTCIIALNGMRFLGEPERYLEFAILPLSFMTSILMIQGGNSRLWFLSFAIATYAAIVSWKIIQEAKKVNLRNKEEEELCKWLSGMKPLRIMTIPLKAVSILVYRTGHKGLNILTNISEKSQQEKFRELCPILYPYPNSDLKKLIREYKLDLIIIHKPVLTSLWINDLNIHYDLSRFKMEYENGSYVAYSV